MSGGASTARAGGYRSGCPGCVRAARRGQPACPKHYVPIRNRLGGKARSSGAGGSAREEIDTLEREGQ